MGRLINELLNRPESPLRTYAKQAKELQEFETRLLAVLPDDLRPHCRLARFSPEAMVWLASTPAWATRLRFHTQELLTAAQKAGGAKGPRSVHVKVSSEPLTQAEVRPPRSQAPSPAAAASLRELAATTRNPGLRDAVCRLAELARQPAESVPKRRREPEPR